MHLLLAQPCQQVLSRLVELACDLLNASASAIWTVHGQELVLEAASTGYRHGDRLPLRGSLIEFDWDNGPEGFQQVAKEQYGSEEAAIPSSYIGKARAAIISEHNDRVIDSLGICNWPYILFVFQTLDKATQFFNLATGKDWSVEQLQLVGERIRNLERMFDVRQGMNREMDILPDKFFNKPLTKGKYEGAVLDRGKFEQMKDEYYEKRGWDKTTGLPTPEKLDELELAVVN